MQKALLKFLCLSCLCLPCLVFGQAPDTHKNFTEQTPTSQCLACHKSYEVVAERTQNVVPNPHASHRGNVNCMECHSFKGQQIFMCNDCHAFQTKEDGFHLANRK